MNHHISRFRLTILCFLLFGLSATAQKYITRTAHINVKSENRFTTIEADNYQVASVFDAQTGNIDYIGLLKSFEFKLGAADQLFNSKMVDVSAHPNIKFTGKIYDIQRIDFSKPGEHTITVNGVLYIWDEKRVTSAVGKMRINADGSIEATSSFNMVIEDGSVEKANQLMREKLPSVIAVDTETLGISKNVAVNLTMTYKAK
ncbi:MAG: hypothetical protein AAF960_04725 [Bacteroidota bacterium]